VVSFESKYLKCIVTTQIRPELYAFYLFTRLKNIKLSGFAVGTLPYLPIMQRVKSTSHNLLTNIIYVACRFKQPSVHLSIFPCIQNSFFIDNIPAINNLKEFFVPAFCKETRSFPLSCLDIRNKECLESTKYGWLICANFFLSVFWRVKNVRCKTLDNYLKFLIHISKIEGTARIPAIWVWGNVIISRRLFFGWLLRWYQPCLHNLESFSADIFMSWEPTKLVRRTCCKDQLSVETFMSSQLCGISALDWRTSVSLPIPWMSSFFFAESMEVFFLWTHGLKWLVQETSSSHANSNKRENQVPHKNSRHIFWTKSFDTRIGASHAIIGLLRSSVAGMIPNFCRMRFQSSSMNPSSFITDKWTLPTKEEQFTPSVSMDVAKPGGTILSIFDTANLQSGFMAEKSFYCCHTESAANTNLHSPLCKASKISGSDNS